MSRPRLWTSLIYNRKGFFGRGSSTLEILWTSFFHIVLEYIHSWLYVLRFSLPRLEYRGEFWLHHQDIPSLSRLWMVFFFFFFTRCIYHPNLGTIILSSLIRPIISHSNNELLCCLVLARPWFGRLQLSFYLVLSFRRICLVRFYPIFMLWTDVFSFHF